MSCFGSDDRSDNGDNWTIECVSSNSDHWERDDNIRLRHSDTDA